MRHATLVLAAAVAATTTQVVSAQQPSYDRHFLDSTEYFIANREMSGAHQYVAVGRMVTVPTETSRGEAQFLVVGGGAGFTIGQRVWTRYFWTTRPAAAADAALGTVVFCLDKQAGGVYQGPASREEALNEGWWMTTVTDLSDLHRQEVRAGQYRLGLDCLRVSATVPAGGLAQPGPPPQLDAHFLDSAEYFIANREMRGAHQYVAVGRMVTGPTETSRGEAQFLVVGGGAGFTIGQRVWTRYYWRTRKATADEARVGTVVFCLDAQEQQTYRGPRDRSEALNAGWWMTTITDISDLYRQEVRAGNYRFRLDCLRVAR